MQLHLLNRSSVNNQSLKVTYYYQSRFIRVWHYHPEFELVLIQQSTGTRFIGDSIIKFKEKEVVLIGSNVPHMWLNDDEYFQEDSALKSEAVVLHFKKEFLGKEFFNVPEMKMVSNLLNKAERGIKFCNLPEDVIREIDNMRLYSPPTRIHKIIEILFYLASHEQYELLSSSSFVNSSYKTENKRLHKVYEYVFENFNNPINSSDVAEVAGMNNSAFSRFFKKTHGKSFITFLNEIRIGCACKLLLERKESITSIAYMSGFNTISNFNRQFRSIHGKSPSAYLKDHKQENLQRSQEESR